MPRRWVSTAYAVDIFVIGGKPDDPFWSIAKRGAEDAGALPGKGPTDFSYFKIIALSAMQASPAG